MRQFVASAFLLLSFCCLALAQQTATPDNAPPASPKADSAKSKKMKAEPAAQTTAPATAQPAPPPPPEPPKEPAPDKASPPAKDDAEHYDMTEVAPVVTHHQITLDGKVLRYTATAGRLPIKRGDGKIRAEMFFVAYTLDGPDNAKRPLTFAFNGGPGSASVWLHMGSVGPKQVVLQANGFMPPPP